MCSNSPGISSASFGMVQATMLSADIALLELQSKLLQRVFSFYPCSRYSQYSWEPYFGRQQHKSAKNSVVFLNLLTKDFVGTFLWLSKTIIQDCQKL